MSQTEQHNSIDKLLERMFDISGLSKVEYQ